MKKKIRENIIVPTYEFKNTETDEVFEKFMKYEDKVKYLEDNPHIKTYYSNCNFRI